MQRTSCVNGWGHSPHQPMPYNWTVFSHNLNPSSNCHRSRSVCHDRKWCPTRETRISLERLSSSFMWIESEFTIHLSWSLITVSSISSESALVEPVSLCVFFNTFHPGIFVIANLKMPLHWSLLIVWCSDTGKAADLFLGTWREPKRMNSVLYHPRDRRGNNSCCVRFLSM